MPVAPTSFADLLALAQTEITTRDPTLTDFSEGSNLDALAGANAVLADETNRIALNYYRSHLLDFAEGTDLDTLALDRFGLERNTASSSVGTVTWTEGSASSYTIPAGTVLEGTGPDGATFSATTTVAAVSDAGRPIPVQAVSTGRATNVPAGSLTAPSSAFTADPTATVTLASRMAGGADDEKDEQFRARLRLYYNTLSEATRSAVIRAVTSVPGVYYAIPSMLYNSDGSFVFVYVADADGAGNSALVSLAQTALDSTIALGIKAKAVAAVRQEFRLELVLTIPAGNDQTTAAARVRAAVLDYANNVPIGHSAYLSEIYRRAHNAYAPLIDITATSNSAAFVTVDPLASTHTLRLASGDLSVSFIEEPV